MGRFCGNCKTFQVQCERGKVKTRRNQTGDEPRATLHRGKPTKVAGGRGKGAGEGGGGGQGGTSPGCSTLRVLHATDETLTSASETKKRNENVLMTAALETAQTEPGCSLPLMTFFQVRQGRSRSSVPRSPQSYLPAAGAVGGARSTCRSPGAPLPPSGPRRAG